MMNTQITFLGTCACDFSPRLRTDCKDRFDNDARRSSAIMIGESVLIDCGIHTLESLRIADKDIKKITDVFITHLHSDHFNADNLRAIAKEKDEPLRVWVREGACVEPMQNVETVQMKQFETYRAQNGISVVGMPANHDPAAHPQHFVITVGDKNLFYGCDGAWLLNETYIALRGAKLDMAVLDATVGDYVGDLRAAEHNSIPMIRLLLPSLRTIGAIDENTVIYLSHIAPSLHVPHEKTVEIAKGFGAKVAFDGEITTL